MSNRYGGHAGVVTGGTRILQDLVYWTCIIIHGASVVPAPPLTFTFPSLVTYACTDANKHTLSLLSTGSSESNKLMIKDGRLFMFAFPRTFLSDNNQIYMPSKIWCRLSCRI
jgi:hypothetical protein